MIQLNWYKLLNLHLLMEPNAFDFQSTTNSWISTRFDNSSLMRLENQKKWDFSFISCVSSLFHTSSILIAKSLNCYRISFYLNQYHSCFLAHLCERFHNILALLTTICQCYHLIILQLYGHFISNPHSFLKIQVPVGLTLAQILRVGKSYLDLFFFLFSLLLCFFKELKAYCFLVDCCKNYYLGN